jgi:hypothetical protein
MVFVVASVERMPPLVMTDTPGDSVSVGPDRFSLHLERVGIELGRRP